MSIEIEFKDSIWCDGFPTCILNLEHARNYASKFPGALRFKYRGEWHQITSTTKGADIVDTEITGYEVKDSN